MEHPPAPNRLLTTLSAEDFALLEPHLELLRWERGRVLAEPNTPHEFVYFPVAGIVSVVTITSNLRRIEIGIYGRDGFGPTSTVLGVDRTPYQHFVQVSGGGWRLPSRRLADAVARSASLRTLLSQYAQVFTTQTGYTAMSNGSNSIPERLARWLLMCHDRCDGNDLDLTHDFISTMLGVRRAGVTQAIHVLEGERMIRNTRGLVRILDRQRLEEVARDSYGVPEAEYRRVIGRM